MEVSCREVCWVLRPVNQITFESLGVHLSPELYVKYIEFWGQSIKLFLRVLCPLNSMWSELNIEANNQITFESRLSPELYMKWIEYWDQSIKLLLRAWESFVPRTLCEVWWVLRSINEITFESVGAACPHNSLWSVLGPINEITFVLETFVPRTLMWSELSIQTNQSNHHREFGSRLSSHRSVKPRHRACLPSSMPRPPLTQPRIRHTSFSVK